VRPITAGEIGCFLDVFDAAWGFARDDGQRQRTATIVAAESAFGAFAEGGIAGTVMSFAMELTVPGQAQVPMAGVSYVAVHPLRRRRGVLRALMSSQLDDLHARGVPLAGLGASEAGIYGRFGYGPATWDSSWRLARGAARGLAAGNDGCHLDMIGAPEARELLPAVHEQAHPRPLRAARRGTAARPSSPSSSPPGRELSNSRPGGRGRERCRAGPRSAGRR
jgi:GNAT superfamily N-acetyltransferase